MVAWREIVSEVTGIATDQSLWKKSGYGANKLPEVVELQKWLNANGFNAGAEDGVYGKGTANAVRAFQKKQGLAVDGDAGPGTLKAMQGGAPAQPTAPAEPTTEPQGQAQQNNPNADANTGAAPTQDAGTTNAKAGTPAPAPTQPASNTQTGQTQQAQGTASNQAKPDTEPKQGTAPDQTTGTQTAKPDQTTDTQPAQDQTTDTQTAQDQTTGTQTAQDQTTGTQTAAPDDEEEDGIPSDEYLNAPDKPGDKPARKQKETWNINGKEMTKNDINKRINALLRKARAGGVVNAGFQFNSSIGKILHEQLSSAETKELQSIVNAVKDSRYYQLFLNRRVTLKTLQDAGIQGIPGKPAKRERPKPQKSVRKYYKTDPKTGKEVEIDKDEADAMQAKQDKFTNTKRDADGKDDFDRALDGDDDFDKALDGDDDFDSDFQKSKDKIAAMRKGGADVKTTSSSTSTSTSKVTTTGGSSNTSKTSGGGSTTRFSRVMRPTKETEKLRAEKDEIQRKMDALGDKSDGFGYTRSPEYKALKKELNTYRGSDGKIAKSKEMVHPGGEMDSNGNIKYYTKTGKWDGEQYDPKRKNDLRDGEDMTQLNRIVELAGIDSKYKFDVVDDAHVHMKNDKDFYRKEYYPAMCKIAELTKSRKVFDPKMVVMPLVDKGVNSYCAKYNLAKMPDEVFQKEHRQALFDKIYSEEIEQINNGEYT